MNESYRTGHCVCSSCGSAFPKSWLQTRGAVERKGRLYCCGGCADRTEGVALLERGSPNPLIATRLKGTA